MKSLFPIALAVLAVLCIFLELGRMDVYMDNEGQRVAPPFEMLALGDYAIPTLNGEIYLAKPPLLYWMTAGVYRATGVVNEWTGRAVTATFGVLLILLLYHYVRRSVDETIARFTAVGMLAAPYFLERVRWADLDIPLMVTVFAAIAALRASWRATWMGRRLGMIVLAGVCTGAAILLKGPAPLLFLSAALLAEVIVTGNNPATTIRRGVIWTLLCVPLEFLRMVAGIEAPLVLILLLAGWLVLALRNARRRSFGRVAIWSAAIVLGIVVALPWGLTVLYRMGWEWIATLLDNQVVERTYTASRINSGTPLYFVIALPVMLFPWGLLLPWHASRLMWRLGDDYYRFSLITGWLSVFIFSFIAGKEYEYILPATPFLIIATSYHLAWAAAQVEMPGWFSRWYGRWRLAIFALFTIAAVVAVPYVLLAEFHPLLAIETAGLAATILLLLYLPGIRRIERARIVAMGAAAALLVTAVLLITRSFHYGPDRSPRALAALCGRLLEAGHTVESTKTYPPVTWYARRPIPEAIDPDDVLLKLYDSSPYFYLTRQKYIDQMPKDLPYQGMIVAGPIRYRDLLVLSNPAGKAVLKAMDPPNHD